MKNIKFDDIKTPTTVEEFRTNLKTYYVCVGDDNWENRNKLYSQYHLDGWNIDSLDSLSDLYRLEMTRKYTQTPRISPYINFDMKKFLSFYSLQCVEFFGQPCDLRVYAKCMQKCMQLVFKKIRGSKRNLNKWGVLLLVT